MKLLVSVLTSSKKDLEKKLRFLKSVKDIQIDLMDGKFVSSKSLSVKSLPNFKRLKKNAEAHLMVTTPHTYVEELAKKGFKKIIFHVEAYRSKERIHETIDLIKKNKMKVGIALKFGTPLTLVTPFLSKVDTVLVMGVKPGKQGQKFNKKALAKIRALRKRKKNLNIEIDGGITPQTIKHAYHAGANIINSGSYVLSNTSASQALKELRTACKKR